MTADSRIARVRAALDGLTDGDLGPLDDLLSPDVTWQGLTPGTGSCLNRAEVIATLRGRREIGQLIEVAPLDEIRLVAVMRGDVDVAHVLTFAGDTVVAIRSYPGRERVPAQAEESPGEAEAGLIAGPRERPHTLVPFVRVADVERSLRFYESLGFEVVETYEHAARLDWAALRADRAELMLARGHPVDALAQGVLFYLASADLVALREILLRAGVPVTPISDGTPGPKQEMRALDPDGYSLMISQEEG